MNSVYPGHKISIYRLNTNPITINYLIITRHKIPVYHYMKPLDTICCDPRFQFTVCKIIQLQSKFINLINIRMRFNDSVTHIAWKQQLWNNQITHASLLHASAGTPCNGFLRTAIQTPAFRRSGFRRSWFRRFTFTIYILVFILP